MNTRESNRVCSVSTQINTLITNDAIWVLVVLLFRHIFSCKLCKYHNIFLYFSFGRRPIFFCMESSIRDFCFFTAGVSPFLYNLFRFFSALSHKPAEFSSDGKTVDLAYLLTYLQAFQVSTVKDTNFNASRSSSLELVEHKLMVTHHSQLVKGVLRL